VKIGANLSDIRYYTSAPMLLNRFANGPGWQAANGSGNTADNALIPIDEFGNPTSLSFGTSDRVYTGIFVQTGAGPTYYKSGRYYLVYTGTGTFSYANDGVRNAGASSAGREAIDVATPSNNGFNVYLRTTGTAPDHCKIQYLCHEDDEAAILAGEYWDHDFIELIQEQRVLRFLDTNRTNVAHTGNWASRPKTTQIFWGTDPRVTDATYTYSGGARIPGGCPIEAMVDLCNRTNSDLWYQVPCLADGSAADEYELEAATLIKNTLDPFLMCYRESWNEEWNFGTAGGAGLGATEFPTGSTFQRGFNYHILRTVMGGQIWRGVWGARGTASGDRLRVVMGGHAASTARTRAQILYKCDGTGPENNIPAAETYFTGEASQYIDAHAIAPYYYQDSSFPESWTNELDGGLDKLFTEATVGGLVPLATGAPTTGGTSTAYTVTTGLSLADPPPDQTMIRLIVHTATGANPTLTADGGTAYPMKLYRSSTAFSTTNTTTARAFIFDGTTNEWLFCPFTGYTGAAGTGELARAFDNCVAHQAIYATAVNTDIDPVVYESGGHFRDFGSRSHVQDTMEAFNGDARIYDLTYDYLQGLNDAGVTVGCYYNLVGQWSVTGYWGSLQTVYDTRSAALTPKWQALNDFALAQRTHVVKFDAAP
jgi:hypothetical protein